MKNHRSGPKNGIFSQMSKILFVKPPHILIEQATFAEQIDKISTSILIEISHKLSILFLLISIS